MSKYTEIREVLKEDIAEIVELTFKHRLESVINAMMPSILDTVANSIKIDSYAYGGAPENSLHLSMEHTDPVTYTQTTRNIGSPVQIVNPYYIQQMVNKINQLDGKVFHLTEQLNASTSQEAAS